MSSFYQKLESIWTTSKTERIQKEKMVESVPVKT
jgi:hypothetical protein